VSQPDGRIRLQVALAAEEIPTLETFTRRHVGGRAAIILDGEIVTVHKVRSVIPDGRLQISRCSDRACERIMAKLLAERPAPPR
jgi:preprotein translocase subunit SecD